jgi:hypothetical protein
MSQEKKEESEKILLLEWKDYVAIVIAAFQTTLLPIVVTILVLVIMALALRR